MSRQLRIALGLLLFSFASLFSATALDLTRSNLPIMVIDTNGKTIKDEPKITAKMLVFWDTNKENSITDSLSHYDGYIGIELRGNSSQRWDKKPYKIETRDISGENLNVSLLGLPKENDWVLHAPFVDKTLLRNALVYRILNEMGWYAPRYRYCELVINDDYKGVYLLLESLKVDANRIDITRVSTTDLTGSYLLELTTASRLGKDEPFLTTNIAEQVMAIAYPKNEDLTSAHVSYITDYINQFESALHNKKYSGEEDYKNYIDVSSFIDHMLVSEVFRQLDAFCASHHFYKDASGKLAMGPGWDYNRSMGNYKGHDEWMTSGLWLTSPRGGCKPFWSEYIYDDEYFMAAYRQRYAELRKSVLTTGHIYAIIDEYSSYLDEAQERNFQIWDIDQNTSHKYVQGSYLGEIDYVKNWLNDRLNWLDNEWAVANQPVITEFYADGEGTGHQWVELYNPVGTSIDISAWKLSVNGELFTFPSHTTIDANAYLVIASDKSHFTSAYPDVSHVYGGLQGDLLQDELSLELIDGSTVKTEINTSVSSAWPVISKSGNYAVGRRAVAYDYTAGDSWNWSAEEGGTPGKANDIYDYKGLVISEVMSLNTKTVSDEDHQYDDWVELTNNSNYTINLNGLFLTDSMVDYGQWQITDSAQLKNTILAPGKSTLLWLDGDAKKQNNLHANFSVDALGERIILTYKDGYNHKLIDQVELPALNANESYQLVDLSGDEWLVSNQPSPGYFGDKPNGISLARQEEINIDIYPNPIVSDFSVDFYLEKAQRMTMSLVDLSGKMVMSLMQNKELNTGHYTYRYTLNNDVKSGMYLLYISDENSSYMQKVLVVGQ